MKIKEIKVAHLHWPLHFEFKDEPPVEPFKFMDEIWHEGWDIPTRYVVDANNKCWMDDAHGGCFSLANEKQLLNSVTESSANLALRKIFNRKLKLPNWMLEAINSGWTPPSNFELDKYEQDYVWEQLAKNLRG